MAKSAEGLITANHEEVMDAQAERQQLADQVLAIERDLREARSALHSADKRVAEATQNQKIAIKRAARAKRQRDEAEASLNQAGKSDK